MRFSLAILGAILPFVAASPLPMPPNPESYHERNADGSVTPLINLRGQGELGGLIYEQTVDGFTVEKINGNYKYLELAPNGDLVDSGLQAGKDDPEEAFGNSGKKLKKGLIGRIKINNGTGNENGNGNGQGNQSIEESPRHLIAVIEQANGIPEAHSHVARRRTAVTGNKRNLVVAFKFSDHTSRAVPSVADLSVLMNNQGAHTLCPTGSVRDVYLQSSFGHLVLDSTVMSWVTLPNTEAYYAAGNSGMGTMAHIMIRDALNALDATGFDFRPFDLDGDGFVDAIAFLHSGYGAEWGGTDAYGTSYTNRIWSHKWALYSLPNAKWTSDEGVSVYNYHVSPSVWGTSGSVIGRIGVIAHETGHFFGLPDLYDGSGGQGIGSFGLMANSWGFDSSQYYPPHMSAWSKIQLGWLTPTVITAAGTYSVRQACDYPDAYIINHNFPSGEYLLIENRQRCDFDSKIAGPGLAIFHIDESASCTQEGYPGQSGWPTNGYHYRVALLQADGGYDLEKGLDRGDSTDLFHGAGVNSITPSGTSAGAAYPNTKAYKGGTIINTGVYITNISTNAPTMTFSVGFDGAPSTQAPTAAPRPIPYNRFELTLTTDNYGSETGWMLTRDMVTVASKAAGSYASNTKYTEKVDLSDGSYQFTITDSHGDGICCSYGQGSYMVTVGTNIMKTGGMFGSTDTSAFAVGVVKPPTLPPTTRSPTRRPTKPPTRKPTPAPTKAWTRITFDDFENGLGNFVSAGVDAFRTVSSTYAHQGTAALQLRDDTSTSIATLSSNKDVTPYQKLRVHFWFYPVSFDNSSEDFFLEWSCNGGKSWKTVKQYRFSIEFQNNRFYEDSVYIDRASSFNFSNQVRIRFRADASDDDDQVYLDEIEFAGQA